MLDGLLLINEVSRFVAPGKKKTIHWDSIKKTKMGANFGKLMKEKGNGRKFTLFKCASWEAGGGERERILNMFFHHLSPVKFEGE